MKPVRTLARLLLALGAPLLLSAAAAAQNYKLSEPLPTKSNESITWVELAPGGAHVAYVVVGGGPTGNGTNLWSLRTDASAEPARLAPSPLVDAELGPFLTPDGTRAVFVAGATTRELRSAPLDGSGSSRLLASGPISRLALFPDGSRIVFQAGGLWVVPTDGHAPAQLVVETPGAQDPFRVSPDGNWIVFSRTLGISTNLYSVRSDGSSTPRLLNLLRQGVTVQPDFAPSFDGLGVVYRSDEDVEGEIVLHGVPIDGVDAPFTLSAPLPGADVDGFELSTVDDRLLYWSGQRLFSLRVLAGGAPLELDTPTPSLVERTWLDASATWVLHRTVGERKLFSQRADGSTPAVLLGEADSLPRLAGAHVLVGRGQFSSSEDDPEVLAARIDGSQPLTRLNRPRFVSSRPTLQDVLADGSVLFTANEDDASAHDLYRAPPDGSAEPVRLNSPAVQVERAFALPGTQAVLYLERRLGSDSPWFFSVSLASGLQTRLPGSLAGGEPQPVNGFSLSPDGRYALYGVDYHDGVDTRLYSVAADGSAPPARVNPRVFDTLVRRRVTSDSARAVFVDQATMPSASDYQLLSAPLDGSGTPTVLTGPTQAGEARLLEDLQLGPDGAVLTYRVSSALFVAPVDGSALPRQLDTGVVLSRFDHAGERVVYEKVTGSTRTLFSLRVDGSQAPIPLLSGASLEMQVSPTDERVVARQGLGLVSVPLDGSQASVLLHASARISSFQISADGRWVVYRSDEAQFQQQELFSVPIDGSAAPVRLSAALPSGASVGQYGLDPDSLHAVYVADQEVRFRFELYSVPLAGGQAPVKLSGALVAGGQVLGNTVPNQGFALDARGRVVYRADAWTDGVIELFCAPLDGSAPPVRVSGAPRVGNVYGFALTPDGTRAVFASDRNFSDVFELFLAPLDGSRSPRVLNAPLVPGGDVLGGNVLDSFEGKLAISPDSRHVYYLADQEKDGRLELFGTYLGRYTRSAERPTAFR